MSFTRRSLVMGATLLGATGFAGSAPSSEATARKRLHEIFSRMETDFLNRSPEHATSLGIDHGANAGARSRLDDRSLAGLDAKRRANSKWVAALEAASRTSLSPDDRLDCDVVLFIRRGQSLEAEHFVTPIAEPYVVSQRDGSYQQIPEFLVVEHKINSTADLDAYYDRLRAFAVVLDQETDRIRHDADAGVIPPDFILDTTLAQLRTLRDSPPEKLEMISALRTKANDGGSQASRLFSSEIAPALARQVTALEASRARASHAPGVWQLRDGEAYYQACLLRETTSDLSVAEVAALGEERVAAISHEIDQLLRATGRDQGSVGERLAALGNDRSLDYPKTREARAQALQDATELIAGMEQRLPQIIRKLPHHRVQVKRVPEAIEAGAALAHYDLGSLDGSRPGIFYLNLNPELQCTTWQLPTLAYHEAVPGHHLHASIQQESERLPLIRKTTWFGAFNEGWSLYAEQLADEAGAYDGKPLARIGYLSYALLRAARLVVDTGLHAKRWSRERAIGYFEKTLGSPKGDATSEIDRYCASPGQACSYMVGKQTLLRLRESTRTRLGARFDIRDFHDVILAGGSVPLTLLPRIVDRYV